MKNILMLFSLILLLSSVSAAGPLVKISLNGNNLTVKGFIFYDNFGQYPAPIITDFQEIIGTFNNVTNVTDLTNVNYTKDIYINYNNNNSLIVSTDANLAAYRQCLDEKAQYSAGLNSCVASKNENALYKDNYTETNAKLIVCNGDLSRVQSEKEKALKDYSEIENAKWIYGAIGIILGIVGVFIYTGKLFGPKVKSAEETFNRQQSG